MAEQGSDDQTEGKEGKVPAVEAGLSLVTIQKCNPEKQIWDQESQGSDGGKPGQGYEK